MKYKTVTLTPQELLQNMIDGVVMVNDSGNTFGFNANGTPVVIVGINQWPIDMTKSRTVRVEQKWYEELKFPCLVRNSNGDLYEIFSVNNDFLYFVSGNQADHPFSFIKASDCELVSDDETKGYLQGSWIKIDDKKERWVIKLDNLFYVSAWSAASINQNDACIFKSERAADDVIDGLANSQWRNNAKAVKLN